MDKLVKSIGKIMSAIALLVLALLALFKITVPYMTTPATTLGFQTTQQNSANALPETTLIIPVDLSKNGPKKITIKDQEGKKVNIDSWRVATLDEHGDTLVSLAINVLPEQYLWECGSNEQIKHNNTTTSFSSLKHVVTKLDQKNYFKDAKSLLCLGTSSHADERKGDEKRATDRAENMVDIFYKTLSTSFKQPIYPLSFGKHLTKTNDIHCSDKTSNQRRVVFIKTIREKDNLSSELLTESLKKIFKTKANSLTANFPIDITQYSLYKNARMPLLGYGKNMKVL